MFSNELLRKLDSVQSPSTLTCKLESGEIVPYAAYGKRADQYDPRRWKLIGYGVIWEINGIKQTDTKKCYFFELL